MTKNETLEFLQYLKEANKNKRLATPEHLKTISYMRVLKMIQDSDDVETVYQTIATLKNSTEESKFYFKPFENIYYREDCYDYLIACNLSDEEARKITYRISYGGYDPNKLTIGKDKLSPEFIKWATESIFLTSRYYFFELFYREYEEFKFVNKYPMPRKDLIFDAVEKDFNEKLLSNPDVLYTCKYVKGSSSMIDPNNNQIVATDWIAKRLLETNLLDKIKPVKMPEGKTYLVEGHDGKPTTKNETSNRDEERCALTLFDSYCYKDHARLFFADYQTPICRDSKVKNEKVNIGKVDLLAVSRAEEKIYLMELKYHDNTESLLRCVTEIYTYFKQIDKHRLGKEVGEKFDLMAYGEYKVVPAILIFEGSRQHLQLRSGYFKNVQKLMLKLGIECFVIRSDEPVNSPEYYEFKYNFRVFDIPVEVINNLNKDAKKGRLNMNLDKALDYAIRDYEMQKDPSIGCGYKIDDNHNYDNYMSEEAFNKLKDEMPEKARKNYGDGSGSELEVRTDKAGNPKYPPKMASFGSSSRFIYTLVYENRIENFAFELKLPTKVGGTANLDGYLENDKHIFIEAKCREPYGTKANEFGVAYEKLYDYIDKSTKSNVNCKTVKTEDEKKITADFSLYINNDDPRQAVKHFDIKQMISHLLGIGVAVLRDGKYLDKPIKFLYLIYDPRNLTFKDEKICEEIVDIYSDTCCECESVDFKNLFAVILEYLQDVYKFGENVNVEKIVQGFTFGICSQFNFNDKLSERN